MCPTMNGRVEHPTEIGTIDRTALHADSDEASRELVHDHEHPTEEERPHGADQPVAQREVRRPPASTAQDDQLLLE